MFSYISGFVASITLFIMFHFVSVKWYVIYTVFLLIVHSLICLIDFFCYCLMCFLSVCYSCFFLCWCCLIDHCWCELFLHVSGFKSVLECHPEGRSLCVYPTDPRGIVWPFSVLASCVCCSW